MMVNRGVDLTVAIESPLQDEVRQLIGELNQALLALTPAEFCYHMTAEEMARPDTTVFVAREDGAAVACGALRRHDGGIGEVKRMYTRPSYQRRGIGGRILEAIESLARAEGISRLVLETGDRHAAAWRVYERGGFARCGAVLDYPDSGYSVFYAKSLVTEDAGVMSDVMPAQAGTHATLRQLPPSGVDPRLRGDDEVWS